MLTINLGFLQPQTLLPLGLHELQVIGGKVSACLGNVVQRCDLFAYRPFTPHSAVAGSMREESASKATSMNFILVTTERVSMYAKSVTRV